MPSSPPLRVRPTPPRRDIVACLDYGFAESHSGLLSQEAVLKGQAPAGGIVSFWFAASRDVLWDRSPKPKVGQDAVWILSRNERNGLQLQALTAFDSRKVQPRDRQELLGRLLKSSR